MISIIKFSILLIFVLNHKGYITTAEPILGDNVRKVELNEFPFVVSIGRRRLREKGKEENAHFCSGSLVTKQHVLTASHCLRRDRLREIEVTINSIDLREGKKFRVSAAITYDEWAETGCIRPDEHDIAVLRLAKCVKFDIKLPIITEEQNLATYGETANIAGWGETNTEKISRFLMTAEVQILDPKKCWKKARKFIHYERICTKGNPYTFVGCGDSGGPLIIDNNIIIGINHAICPSRINYPKFPDTSRMSIHVPIVKYIEFIKATTKVIPAMCTIA